MHAALAFYIPAPTSEQIPQDGRFSKLWPTSFSMGDYWCGSTGSAEGLSFRGMPNDLSQIRRAAFATSLRRCYLFSEFPAQDLKWIASFVVHKRLGKGDYLFRQGAPAEGFYVVHQGAINVHRINASGKAQVIHVFRVGESFAEAALFENTGYPANASALEQTSVLLVPKTAFLELLRKRPELALRMLASMSRHL